MRLHNVVTLVWGELLNEPTVTSINDLVSSASKVHRGDLFIVYDTDDIPLAIERGAFALLFDQPIVPTDMEIAWIKVHSLHDALLRLAGYFLLERHVTAIACDGAMIDMAEQIVDDPTCHFLVHASNWFECILSLPPGCTLFFETGCGYDTLFSDAHIISQDQCDLDLMKHTLFESTFSINGQKALTRPFPPFLLPRLARLCHQLNCMRIHWNLERLQLHRHFQPIFIDESFSHKPFGTTKRVLIFEPDSSLFAETFHFLEQSARWAHCIYLLPQTMQTHLPESHLLRYNEKEAIMPQLRSTPFHFALIAAHSYELPNDKPQRLETPTLF